MNISLQGKVAVVTGASSGIGLAITQTYFDCDAAGVIAVFRRTEIPEDLTKALELYPDRLVIVHGDVAEEQTSVDFTKAALDHFGRLDILVSNAAISIVKAGHLHTPEEWDAVINTNVKSLYWAARHVIPVMMKRKSGLILISGSLQTLISIELQLPLNRYEHAVPATCCTSISSGW